MSAGVWVTIVAVAVALAFGGYRKLADGKFVAGRSATIPAGRGARSASDEPRDPATEAPDPTPTNLLTGTPWIDDLGERATLLQFSSAFCAPCRATRRILTDVAADTKGVVHIEVDAEQHLDVVRRLGILRTPTTIVLDAQGVERGRAVGAPRRDQVERSLEAAGLG